jgi:predicted GNAT family N-acyltransferase
MTTSKTFNSDNLYIRQIDFDSREYQAELVLRDKILRQPLGMSLFDEDLSQDRNDFHFCAFYNEQLIAVVLLSPLISGELKMRQVAINQDFQSLKIGSKMIIYCEQFAREYGYAKIVLNARKTALEFYKKSGYCILSDEFLEVGIPHYKMAKTL